MSHYSELLESVSDGVDMSPTDMDRVRWLNSIIPGYSDEKHYGFFRALVALPGVRDILMLGVYHGRDIAYIRDNILRHDRTERIKITGVDKFNDESCEDWPETSKGLTWSDAGFGPPPSLEKTLAILQSDYISGVTLIKSDDSAFLESTEQKFDAIYLDTAHDAETVNRQLRQVRRIARGDAIICGDDYSDISNAGGAWGVKSAVNAAFNTHTVFGGWIWASCISQFKEP